MILEKILKKFNLRIKSEKGDGISIVIFGTIVMLMLVFTSVNILNAKIVEEKYNTLRDSIQGAAAGSVIHLLLNENGATTTQHSIISGTNSAGSKYDIYLQLALGYLVGTGNPSDANSITVVEGAKNDFIKLDHKKVIQSSLELICKTVLNKSSDYIIGDPDYDIVMFFIEPNYNTSYAQSFDLIAYRTYDPEHGIIGEAADIEDIFNNSGKKIPVVAGNLGELYDILQKNINTEVNRTSGSGPKFSIDLGAGGDGLGLIRAMQTRPYYLIVVKDFELPTLFADGTKSDSTFRDAFTFTDGKIQTPMCALQAGKVERKISN